MYVCMYACMYMYMYVHICMYVCMYVYMYVCIYDVYMYTRTYMYTSICTCKSLPDILVLHTCATSSPKLNNRKFELLMKWVWLINTPHQIVIN